MQKHQITPKQKALLNEYIDEFVEHRDLKSLTDKNGVKTWLRMQYASEFPCNTDMEVILYCAYIENQAKENPEYSWRLNKERSSKYWTSVKCVTALWDFRYNEIMNQQEYRPRGSKNPWQIVNIDNVYNHLTKRGVEYKREEIASWIASDDIPLHNPVYEYFQQLPEWDGKDYISILSNCIHIESKEKPKEGEISPEQAFFNDMLRKHLIRSVRQAIEKEVNRYCIVFQSDAQSVGKSQFVRWLNPISDDYFMEQTELRQWNKDDDIRLGQSFTCLFDEIEISENSLSKLKAIISRDKKKVRKPYGKHDILMYRLANFYATTNTKNFLIDDRNERFLSFSVSHINHDYDNIYTGVNLVPKEQLWAQVLHLYYESQGNPEEWLLTKEERATQASTNDMFMSDSVAVLFVLKNYRVLEEHEMGNHREELHTVYQIWARLCRVHPNIYKGPEMVGRELKKLKDPPYINKVIQYYEPSKNKKVLGKKTNLLPLTVD